MTVNTTNGRAALAPYIIPPADERPIQVGPDYCCFDCGHPVLGLMPWPVHPDPRKRVALDDYAAHIAYLQLPRSCWKAGHREDRVAKLGAAITPLHFVEWAGDGIAQQLENVTRLRAALAYLAAHAPEAQRDPDPITALVYGLLAGQLAPHAAIERIRSLIEDN